MAAMIDMNHIPQQLRPIITETEHTRRAAYLYRRRAWSWQRAVYDIIYKEISDLALYDKVAHLAAKLFQDGMEIDEKHLHRIDYEIRNEILNIVETQQKRKY